MRHVITFACLAISMVLALPQFAQQDPRFLRSDVNQDIQDFIDMIPHDKITEIVKNRIATDPEIANLWAYMTSEATKAKVLELEAGAEWNAARGQLESVGVDGARLINMVHDILGWDHVTRSAPVSVRLTPRVVSSLSEMLLLEILPQIPILRMQLLAVTKFTFSSQFRRLVYLMLSPSFQASIANVFATEIVQFLMADGRANGIDVDAIFEFFDSLNILGQIKPRF